MPLNTAQYVAPLDSQGVLSGLVQGVKQGPGISILPDGTITLDASTSVGFVITNNPTAAQYVWPTIGATEAGQQLADDGTGNLYWSSDFVKVVPSGGTFNQLGAAAIPAGSTGNRPNPAPAGYFRFNTTNNYLEFSNGSSWIPVSPPTGGVFSFVQPTTPIANAIGDMWYDTTISTEKVWNGSVWLPVTPLATTTLPGRVQIGSNIKVNPSGVISVDVAAGVPGGTGNLGLTTLTDNVTSTSIDSALTANQGRVLQDQINALAIANNLTFAGSISGSGVLTYVTPEGSLQGFVVGAPLPSPSLANEGYFVVVESAGGFAPPGGSFTTVTQGDWFESTGAVWQYLNFGYDPPIASTTQYGITRLATVPETQAGTSDALAVTPAGLFSVFNSGIIDANDILLNPILNGDVTVQQALADAVYDITSTGNTINIVQTPTGKFNIEVTQATETQLGGAEIATNAETQALTSDSLIVTPLKLGNLFASGAIDANDILLNPTINGNTNVQDALDDAIYNVVSTDSSVTVVETAVGQIDVTVTQATETQLGGGQIATQAETNAGLLDDVLLTPSKLAGYISSGQITAPEIPLSPAINGNLNVQAALNDAVYDITSTGNTLGITVTATGLYNLDVVQATTTQLGGAELATTAEALAGTNTTNIITPDTMRTATVYKSDFNAKGDLLSASANDAPVILPVGGDGQFLRANSLTSSGLVWDTLNASSIVVSPAINGNTNLQTVLQDAVYDINSVNGSITITETATGINDIVVTQATETQLGGAEIATQAETDAGLSDTVVITPKKLAAYISGGQITASEVVVTPAINGNTNVQSVLADAVYDINSANSSITITETATGINDIVVAQATESLIAGAEIATQVETEAGTDNLRMVTPLKLRTAAVYKSDFIAKGDILSAQGPGQPLILPVGTNAQFLVADITTPTGLAWYSLPTTVGVLNGVSNLGITTITDNTTSTSINSALSARMGKVLQDQINALAITNNLTFAGTLNSVGVLTYVTTEGAAAGFTVGSTLPVAAAGNKEYFVICEQAGTITPPGGVATSVTQGDWFVSTGTSWQFLNVGFDVPLASTTQAGIVELATNAETQTGTDATKAVTPAGLSSRAASETLTGIAELATQAETQAGTDDTRIVTPLKLRTATVYKSDYNNKGDILSASADNTPVILSVGTNGQYLRADSTQTTGLIWDTISASDITVTPAINGNTNLNTILNDAIYDVTSANASLTVSIAATGLVTLTAQPASTVLAGVVELATPAEVVTGTSTTLATTPDGVRQATVYKSDFNAKGDLLSASANDTPAILSVGTNGQVLKADSTTTTGLTWAAPFAFYTLDNISAGFNGINKIFNLSIGGVAYTPSPTSNIMVFLGGVAQIPGVGNAYTVAGSTITFDSAPPANTSFYATTIR